MRADIGLHICYELSVPGETSDDDVVDLLERLCLYALASELGHQIQLDKPTLVVQSIRDVLAQNTKR